MSSNAKDLSGKVIHKIYETTINICPIYFEKVNQPSDFPYKLFGGYYNTDSRLPNNKNMEYNIPLTTQNF